MLGKGICGISRPLILELGRRRPEDHEFRVSLKTQLKKIIQEKVLILSSLATQDQEVLNHPWVVKTMTPIAKLSPPSMANGKGTNMIVLASSIAFPVTYRLYCLVDHSGWSHLGLETGVARSWSVLEK